MPTYAELKEQRGQLCKQMIDMNEAVKAEERDFTPEENEKWNAMDRDQEALKPQIDRVYKEETTVRLQDEVGTQTAMVPVVAGQLLDQRGGAIMPRIDNGTKPDVNLAIRDWLSAPRTGYQLNQRSQINMQALGMNQHQRELTLRILPKAPKCREDIEKYMLECRQQGVGTGGAGGFMVPDEMMREIEIAMLDFNGVRQAGASVLRTATGADLPIPQTDDTTNKGAIIDENTADTEQDVVFTQLVLKSFMYTSRIVKVSWELMQDSATNMNQLLGQLLGERLGRIAAEHNTTGVGTTEPLGVVTGSVASGVVTAATSAITWENMIDLKHSVDPSYRRRPAFGYMFNDTSLAILKKLQDSQNRPLWGPLVQAGAPDTFDGTRYTVNQEMPDPADVNAKAVLAGDFSKYIVREVMDLTLTRLDERYAEFRQVAFMANLRMDGNINDAGTGPIKSLAMSAT